MFAGFDRCRRRIGFQSRVFSRRCLLMNDNDDDAAVDAAVVAVVDAVVDAAVDAVVDAVVDAAGNDAVLKVKKPKINDTVVCFEA